MALLEEPEWKPTYIIRGLKALRVEGISVTRADSWAAAGHRRAALVRAGEVSPAELVQAHLEQIERVNPKLNAWQVVRAERALDEAKALARRSRSFASCHWRASRSRSRTTSR